MPKSARLVREARMRAGLGQTELSALAGIPLRTLTRIESGDKSPIACFDDLIELARSEDRKQTLRWLRERADSA